MHACVDILLLTHLFFPFVSCWYWKHTEKTTDHTCKCKVQERKVPTSTPRRSFGVPCGLFATHGASRLWSSRHFLIQHSIPLPERRASLNLVGSSGWSCRRCLSPEKKAPSQRDSERQDEHPNAIEQHNNPAALYPNFSY